MAPLPGTGDNVNQPQLRHQHSDTGAQWHLMSVENKYKDDRIFEYFSTLVWVLTLYNKKILMTEEIHKESHQNISIRILIYNI